MSIQSYIDSFPKLTILVIGDIMMDSYFFGSIDRISPEAPVPVIAVSKKENRLGGAANVALNIKALGAQCLLCSVIGTDEEGKELLNLLKKEDIQTNGIFKDSIRPTTVKTRVISANQHLLRIDNESTKSVSSTIETQIVSYVNQNINDIQAIIFEDYNKGLLTPKIITAIIEIANKNKVPTIVDPKLQNFFMYKGCTLFKPNRKEIKEGLKTEMDLSLIENMESASQKLIEKLDCQNVMVTLSEDGVYLKTLSNSNHIKAHPRKIIDVSGAGDTVVSVAALSLASGMEIDKVAEISNLAGGMVCQKVGVVPINVSELKEEIERLKI